MEVEDVCQAVESMPLDVVRFGWFRVQGLGAPYPEEPEFRFVEGFSSSGGVHTVDGGNLAPLKVRKVLGSTVVLGP